MGKINKHLAEICFEDQMFVKDDKKINNNFIKICNEILNSERTVNNIKELIEKVPDMSELKKSQVFYKYYLDKEELNDENVKYVYKI